MICKDEVNKGGFQKIEKVVSFFIADIIYIIGIIEFQSTKNILY